MTRLKWPISFVLCFIKIPVKGKLSLFSFLIENLYGMTEKPLSGPLRLVFYRCTTYSRIGDVQLGLAKTNKM